MVEFIEEKPRQRYHAHPATTFSPGPSPAPRLSPNGFRELHRRALLRDELGR